MADFPLNPIFGQVYVSSDFTNWVWDGTAWKATNYGLIKLPVSQNNSGTLLANSMNFLNSVHIYANTIFDTVSGNANVTLDWRTVGNSDEILFTYDNVMRSTPELKYNITSNTLTVNTSLLYVNGTTQLVGIGTTNPQANLHVYGNAIISGFDIAARVNAAMNTTQVFAYGSLVTPNANLNFVNTNTTNAIAILNVSASNPNQANISFNVNSAAINVMVGPLINAAMNTTQVMAYGTLAVSNANLNMINSSTANAEVSQNVSASNPNQANISFNVNSAAINVMVGPLINAAMNTTQVMAYGTLKVSNANLNMVNSTTANADVTQNTSALNPNQANISFTVNSAAINVMVGPLINAAANTAQVLAYGTLTVSNANLNMVNSTTTNAAVVANGSATNPNQANISFTINSAAINVMVGPLINAASNTAQVLAYGTLKVSNANLNMVNSTTANADVTQNTSATNPNQANISFTVNSSAINVMVGPLINAASNTAQVLAYGTLVVSNANLNMINSTTANATVVANGSASNPSQANISFTVNSAAINAMVGPLINTAMNTAQVMAYGTLVVSNANLNFINSTTSNATVAANGSASNPSQANISFSINTSSINAMVGPLINTAANTAQILSYGTLRVSNANLNFVNSTTANADVTANGSASNPSQANITFTVNTAAVNTMVGPTFSTMNTTFGTMNTTFGTVNTSIGTSADAANAAANTVATYAGGVLVTTKSVIDIRATTPITVTGAQGGAGCTVYSITHATTGAQGTYAYPAAVTVNQFGHVTGVQAGTQISGPQGAQGAQGVQGAQGIAGSQGGSGGTGAQGAQGATGVAAGLVWTFSTTLTAADPGAGRFRFNSGTLSSVTAIYLDNSANTDSGTATSDVSAYLAVWDDSTSSPKGYLELISENPTDTSFALFSITSVVDSTGYRTLTVTHIASSTLFANGERVAIRFYRTGDIGAQGAQGAQGVQGATGSGTQGGTIGTGTNPLMAYYSGTNTLDDTPGIQYDSGRQALLSTKEVKFTGNIIDTPVVTITAATSTVTEANAGRVLICDQTGIVNINCAVASTSGFSLSVIRKNTGNVIIRANNASITKLNTASFTTSNIANRYGAATIIYTATNEFILFGDIT